MRSRRLHRTLVRGIAVVTGIALFVPNAAASSWDPTLLVNTESFQTIDSGDGTSDRELRFGDASGTERLLYEVSNLRFRLTRSLQVGGNITATGSIFATTTLASSGTLVFEGAASGSSLFLGTSLKGAGLTDCDTEATSKLMWDATTGRFSCGADQTGGAATPEVGTSSFSGGVLRLGDSRYVNTSGDSMTGALTINLTSGNLGIDVKQTASASILRVSKGADIQGPLALSGALRTDANTLTINDDIDSSDVTLTFGSDSASETLKWLNTADKFQFSDDVSVVGHLSGSTLRIDGLAEVQGALSASGTIRTEGSLSGNTLSVDGNVTLRGETYTFPANQPSTGGILKTDGAGNLTWATSAGDGSGEILSLHPEYPNAIYFGSGSAQVGQLTMSGGTTDVENAYVWTSTKSAIQDYWMSVRVRIPDNFLRWDPTRPIQFRYKTAVNGVTNNHLTLRMKDTANGNVTLSSTGGLMSNAWTTKTITGPESSGTWTPKGYATVYIKTAANNTGNAAAGFLNLNFETAK
ncbi:MAG: hypothetical protein G01um101425_543 [Candidatus Peregrinibacteria bacterium Gr01-1014_25]|nr:MAG: hypothetical protein G01um101425_543 [Candidatus Peregrinibacteria bacterium Gr01-1014_25]